MGWHHMAYTSNVCLEAARKIEADMTLPQDVRDEAKKTMKRILN